MRFLKRWAEDKIYSGEGWVISVGDTVDRFVSFSTWAGDPVCAYHLYLLVEAERKSLRIP
jgi:hypothetical protein